LYKRNVPEINADGGQVGLAELIISKSEQYGRFPDSRVAHNNQLEQVIVFENKANEIMT
jgi:hypothetical protein